MSKFYVAAIFPGVAALACIVLAWYILRRPVPHTAAQPGRVATKPIAPTPTTAPLSPRLTGHSRELSTSTYKPFLLPSEVLTAPRPCVRDMSARGNVHLERTQRLWPVTFTSECRDNTVWPTTAHWRLELPTPVRNVTGVRVASVGLHASEYTVDKWTQTLDIQFGGDTYTVTVPTGMHTTGGSLAGAVQAAIVATHALLSNFRVIYMAVSDNIVVAETTSSPFALLWRSGPSVNTTMWRALGFNLTDTYSTVVGAYHQIAAPNRIDLGGPLAIDVFAEELTARLDGKSLARVYLEQKLGNGHAVVQQDVHQSHTFWPISRIAFLTFKFMVHCVHVNGDGTTVNDYRPYVFNGLNNTLQLQFMCIEYVNPMQADVQLDTSPT